MAEENKSQSSTTSGVLKTLTPKQPDKKQFQPDSRVAKFTKLVNPNYLARDLDTSGQILAGRIEAAKLIMWELIGGNNKEGLRGCLKALYDLDGPNRHAASQRTLGIIGSFKGEDSRLFQRILSEDNTSQYFSPLWKLDVITQLMGVAPVPASQPTENKTQSTPDKKPPLPEDPVAKFKEMIDPDYAKALIKAPAPDRKSAPGQIKAWDSISGILANRIEIAKTTMRELIEEENEEGFKGCLKALYDLDRARNQGNVSQRTLEIIESFPIKEQAYLGRILKEDTLQNFDKFWKLDVLEELTGTTQPAPVRSRPPDQKNLPIITPGPSSIDTRKIGLPPGNYACAPTPPKQPAEPTTNDMRVIQQILSEDQGAQANDIKSRELADLKRFYKDIKKDNKGKNGEELELPLQVLRELYNGELGQEWKKNRSEKNSIPKLEPIPVSRVPAKDKRQDKGGVSKGNQKLSDPLYQRELRRITNPTQKQLNEFYEACKRYEKETYGRELELSPDLIRALYIQKAEQSFRKRFEDASSRDKGSPLNLEVKTTEHKEKITEEEDEDYRTVLELSRLETQGGDDPETRAAIALSLGKNPDFGVSQQPLKENKKKVTKKDKEQEELERAIALSLQEQKKAPKKVKGQNNDNDAQTHIAQVFSLVSGHRLVPPPPVDDDEDNVGYYDPNFDPLDEVKQSSLRDPDIKERERPQAGSGPVQEEPRKTPWGALFLVVLVVECALVAIPATVAGIAELAKTKHASNFGAAEVKDFFFGSPEANFGTTLALVVGIAILTFLAANMVISRYLQDDGAVNDVRPA